MHFILITVGIFAVFALGVWLAPVVRADYGEFKQYVESKLVSAEQRAKDKALNSINKL
jgi:hypothetical protein